jgi:uncharacterized OsmC-like protein/pimeloyl-ACP methyl ester carboxylesterase
MNQEAVTFRNDTGELLHGNLHWPLMEPRAFVLFAHCFTCTSDLRAAVIIARALNQEGLAVLRFDFTGLGQSEGEFADTNFTTNISDLVAASRFLSEHFQAPEILVGHSLGGTAVLAAVARIPSSKAVATIGAPATASHVAHLLSDTRSELEIAGEADVDIGGRKFRMKEQFLRDIEQQQLPGELKNLRRALLVMHAPLDAIVPIENAAEIFTSALHPKSFISLDKADHLLSNPDDARYAATVLAGWAGRYIDPNPPNSAAVSNNTVTASTGSDGFRTAVNAAGHVLTADEPVDVGGQNSGPSPYDLLGAALASCTSMTLQVYARGKKLDLHHVTTDVEHAKIHARDCEECETREGKVDEFIRHIRLEGNLDEKTRARLLEIADRCPVHKTLINEVRIVTTLD